MKVAIYSRHISESAGREISRLESAFRERGAEVCAFSDDVDILVSLGGDGTFLSSLDLVRDSGVPVVGINFGRLGFLTTASTCDGLSWVDDLLADNYTIEERTLLKVDFEGLEGFPYAMNEFSLQRKDATMLGVDVRIDGKPIPTYWADGIVLSTPTGSTAYSMSVGGPIVLPASDVTVIAPIAPHNLNVRPLVVPADTTVEISFKSRSHCASASLDNRNFPLSEGSVIRITRGEFGFKRICLAGDNIITALRSKLMWGEDKRNTSEF